MPCMPACRANRWDVMKKPSQKKLSERTRANMDVVLEETCRQLPHGGDHDSRRFIAERLIKAAEEGQSTLGELGIVARHALAELAGKNGG